MSALHSRKNESSIQFVLNEWRFLYSKLKLQITIESFILNLF